MFHLRRQRDGDSVSDKWVKFTMGPVWNGTFEEACSNDPEVLRRGFEPRELPADGPAFDFVVTDVEHVDSDE